MQPQERLQVDLFF